MTVQNKLIVLDLDGTLFDTSKRFEMCQNESGGNKRAFWECFQSPKYMHLDKPNWKVVEYVKQLLNKEKGAVLVVLSGRSQSQMEETMRQLKEINLPIAEVVLRGEKDFRKDFEFKQDVISKLVEKYRPSEVFIIDDSYAVLNHVKVNASMVYAINPNSL